jgi:hypothetical protein
LELEALSGDIDFSGAASTAAQLAAFDTEIRGLLDRAAALEEVNADVAELGRRLAIPAAEARELAAQFAELRQADGPQATAEALARMREVIFAATDGLADANEEVRALFEGLLEAERRGLELEALSGDIDFSGAASTAAQLARELGISVELASRLSEIRQLGPGARGRGADGAVIFDPRDPRYDPIVAGMEYFNQTANRGAPGSGASAGSGRSGSGAAQMRDTSAAGQMVDQVLRQAERAAVGFGDAMAVLDRRLDTGQVNLETYAAAVELLRDQFETAEGGWGAIAADLEAYADTALDLSAQLGDGLTGAFRSAEGALQSFITTGRADMRAFASAVIADFAMIGARRFILSPLATGLAGAVGGGSGLLSALVAHDGAMVGAGGPGRVVPAALFANAQRMHGGGWPGLRPGEVPIIAERGERVLSRDEVRRGAGSGEVHVHFHGVRDAESFRQSRAQIAADLGRAVSGARRST